jgi:hypothetical protein
MPVTGLSRLLSYRRGGHAESPQGGLPRPRVALPYQPEPGDVDACSEGWPDCEPELAF